MAKGNKPDKDKMKNKEKKGKKDNAKKKKAPFGGKAKDM